MIRPWIKLNRKSNVLLRFRERKYSEVPNGCEKPARCDPCKPACDPYKLCPPPSCEKHETALKCVPDCSNLDGDEGGAGNFYRNVSCFVMIPILILTSIHVADKLDDENLKPREEFVPYSYLCIRKKRFPWGDGNHTFFHNPVRNPVPPGGYETEDPNSV